MQNKLKKYFISGFFFTALLGTLFHFAYDFLGQFIFVGLFTPINESIWEHIKLLYFPMLFFSLYAVSKLSAVYPCTAYGLSVGILTGCLLIPMLYYTYTGILGTHYAPVDIAIYYICVLVAFLLAYRLTLSCKGKKFYPYVKLLLFLFAGAFILFTYMPPALPFFQSP